MFQDQFLGVIEADPNALFELPIIQENQGDQQALMIEMEQQTIPRLHVVCPTRQMSRRHFPTFFKKRRMTRNIVLKGQ